MELIPPVTRAKIQDSCRLVPSIYPAEGILDRVATPEDLPFVLELERWTDDQVSNNLGLLNRIPKDEWVVGVPLAHVIMAAFCHPRPRGCRFNDQERGAWYAALDLETAHAEVVFHRTEELAEVGVTHARMRMRLFQADFEAEFHDIRKRRRENDSYHSPGSYAASQALGRELLSRGSSGILYRSVGREGGECVVCFRPKLVSNLRACQHFEYTWEGNRTAMIRELRSS